MDMVIGYWIWMDWNSVVGFRWMWNWVRTKLLDKNQTSTRNSRGNGSGYDRGTRIRWLGNGLDYESESMDVYNIHTWDIGLEAIQNTPFTTRHVLGGKC